jgi:FkbM family methyltransferase
MNVVPGAKLVGGVWLPETEHHFVKMMVDNKKNHREVDGKLTYQYRKLEDAMNRIPKDRKRVCVDIGAHVGLWAMHLCKFFQHVHCFEPIKLHGDILPHNMPKDNYTLHRCALGDVARKVAIEVPPGVTGNAHVVGAGDIDCYPLDHFVMTPDGFPLIEGHIDFIKIDVEGFELQVVQGAKETLLKHKPFMVLEQKGNDTKFMGQPRNAALNWLLGIGMVSLNEIGGDHFLGWR